MTISPATVSFTITPACTVLRSSTTRMVVHKASLNSQLHQKISTLFGGKFIIWDSYKRIAQFQDKQRKKFKLLLGIPVAGLSDFIDFQYSIDNGVPSIFPSLPPDPVQFPRKPVDLKFAVLLMRSSYEACDDLDFIAMDKFQAKFWKLRQSEVEPYSIQYYPLKFKAGDLTDPLYFDFITFAQYATISEAIRSGELVFQEKLGAFGDVRTVKRDSNLRDNFSIPPIFKERVGDKIYRGLVDGFENVNFGGPEPCPAEAADECIVSGVRSILKIFVDKGYALSTTIDDVRSGKDGEIGFKINVQGPATLWGVRQLASRRSLTLTDFEAMTINAFIRASSRKPSYKSRYNDTNFEHIMSVK